MDTIYEMIIQRVQHLLDRADGPLHFRLVIMPTVVSLLAIRAGLRDARQGRSTFMWTILTNPAKRLQFFRSAVRDIGRIFIVAVVLDTVYQLFVLRMFYVGEMLIVAVTCAIVPYVVIRGPVTLLMYRFYKNQTAEVDKSAANIKEDADGLPEKKDERVL
jgi:hypothetical protein